MLKGLSLHDLLAPYHYDLRSTTYDFLFMQTDMKLLLAIFQQEPGETISFGLFPLSASAQENGLTGI